MNSLQKSYRAFIESVCRLYGRPEMSVPLVEGLEALAEATTTGITRMRLPEEFRKTVADGFLHAIRNGFVSNHATDYQSRHGDMRSYQLSHESATRLMDCIRRGSPDVAIIADDYRPYDDGTVRYMAYATCDWKTVIKLVSCNSVFPPTNPPKLRVLTAFTVDDPWKAKGLMKSLRKVAGKVPEELGEKVPGKKTAFDVARSRAKSIYSDLGHKANTHYNTAIRPLARQIYEQIELPESERDPNLIVELSRRLREAYDAYDELCKQRDRYEWELYHRTPKRHIERATVPELSAEDASLYANQMNELRYRLGRINGRLSQVKQEIEGLPRGEDGSIPDTERERFVSLSKERQDLNEERARISEKSDALKLKIFGFLLKVDG